jgi:DNA topoisomerase-1
MAKYLVIVESPEKAKKIQGYLGKEYKVLASVGHVIDLPAKGLNVDIKKDFLPNYAIMPGKEGVVAGIVDEAKKADLIYLMSDEDREGEAIAWHLSKQLPKGKPFKRAKTNSITKQAVEDAIKNAGDIDYELVDSYETRRILDRLVGYKCSFITTSATGGKSAGRVQSAALRVLAEREKEIRSFVPVEYWDIGADLLTPKKEKISAFLVKPEKMDIKNKEQADKIVADLTKKVVTVTKYDSKEVSTSPRAPFTTSTIQQTAASLFGWDQDKTMRVAQRLYEDGRITYMRTDSVTIVPQFLAATRDFIKCGHAPEYLPKTVQVYSNKAAAQAAHEAIRPVDITVEQIVGEADHRKLYDMIWRRTVASQMEKGRNLAVSARFAVDNYELGANGSVSVFDGWRKVWHWSTGEDKPLPLLKVGDKCDITAVTSEQKFTQPPSRYTKSSITKMYEESGIGRPATYASITKTLKARGYIEPCGNSYQVTDLGIKVCDFLVGAKFCFMDLNFTSQMEDKLDKIGEKELKKLGVLDEFWTRLKCDIDNATTMKKNLSVTNFDCPKCKQKLLAKHGKFGSFFACPDKECKFTCNMDENGQPKERVVVEKVYCSEPCHLCNNKMIQRKGYKGDFFGCEKYPKCRGMRDATNAPIVPKAEGDKPKGFNRFRKFKKKK